MWLKMKKEFVVGTFNLKNDLWNKNWKYREYAKKLSDYLLKNNVDFLGCQELTRKYSKELNNSLLGKYNIYGKYRFKKIVFLTKFDESVGIVSKYLPNKICNKYLSLFPGIPRIMSSFENDDIMIINVHLDYKSKLARKIGFKRLYNYIYKNKEKDIVLLGDFNTHIDNDDFSGFVEKIKRLNINMVDNTHKAFKKNTIDFIFISNCFDVINIWSDDGLMKMSDHRPVFVKIRRKK